MITFVKDLEKCELCILGVMVIDGTIL